MSDVLKADAAASGTFSIGGDLPVNRLGYGAMRLTGDGIWGEPKNPDEARRVLRRLTDLNVNLIDTADSYGPHVNETMISETLAPYPAGLIVATKGGLLRTGPNQWPVLGQPEYIRQSIELSLRRLKTEVIDLWQLHRIDPNFPVEETLGPVKEAQDAGKIRHVGLSEVNAEEIERASKTVKIVSVQNLYNLANRQSEETLNYCEKNDIAFIPWFPVAGGDLVRPGGPLDSVAERHGATVAQLALAWLLHRSPVMLPIPGTSSVAHLEENVAAASLKLSDAEWDALEAEIIK